MLRTYFSHILPPYSRKDISAVILTVLFLLSITILVIINSQQQTILGRAQEAQQAQFVSDQVLVRFKDDMPQSQIDDTLKNIQGRIDHTIEQIKVHVIKVPEGTVEKVVEALSRNPNVEFAEPDYIATIDEIPSDPYYTSEKSFQKILVDKAWDVTHGSNTVIVGNLDTGVDLNHPDLKPIIITSKDFTGETTDGSDNNGHGTKTAGISVAIANNGIGVAGLSYSSRLISGKVCTSSGSCSYSVVASGITWAADNNAKVINMSLGGSGGSSTLQSAVNYAWNKGVVLAAASGNNGTSSLFYPAAYDNVIAVGATDANDAKAYYMNYGTWVDVVAPVDGGLIYTTTRGGGYGGGNGTSFASPQATGLAALIAGQHPNWNNQQIRNQIEQTADKIAGTGTYWEDGLINAYSAVSGTTPTISPTTAQATSTPQPTLGPSSTPTPTLIPDAIPPTVSITSPIDGSTVNRRSTVTITADATDNIGVDHVTFTVAGNSSTDYTAPYTYVWNVSGKPKATYTITATAYDAFGNSKLGAVRVISSK